MTHPDLVSNLPAALREGRPYAACSCGKVFSREQWGRLQFVGYLRVELEPVLELRNCSCRSTCAVEVHGPLLVGEAILPMLTARRHHWERFVEIPGWRGRVTAKAYVNTWLVEVAWVNEGNKRRGREDAEHDTDPAVALENVLELLNLPDEFLAALSRPV